MDVREFGQYLKSLRNEKGLTLDELGAMTGYSNPYLSQIENGKKRTMPSPDLLRKLAEPLGVHYSELMIKAGYTDQIDTLSLVKIAYGTKNINFQVANYWGAIQVVLINENGEFITGYHEELKELEEKINSALSGEYWELTPSNLLQILTQINWNDDQTLKDESISVIFDVLNSLHNLAIEEIYAAKDICNVLGEDTTYKGVPLTNQHKALLSLFLDTLLLTEPKE